MSSAPYVDIDDILAGDERIKCTFETDVLDCGYLDASCNQTDLPRGAVVELPLWLATTLARRGDVTLEPPHFLTKRFRRMLQAGPSSVNLRECSAYVLTVGSSLLPCVHADEQRQVDAILRLCFGGERYAAILNNATSSSSLTEDTTEFTRKLTRDEAKLFEAGSRDAAAFVQWKARNAETVAAPAVIARALKKRKCRS